MLFLDLDHETRRWRSRPCEAVRGVGRAGSRRRSLFWKGRLLYNAPVTSKRLLLLALVLVAGYALLTQEKPEPPDLTKSCDQANALYNQGAYGQALARFNSLLKEDPLPGCAAAGATAVGATRCEQAAILHTKGLNDAAQALYEKVLLGDPGAGCLLATLPPSSLPTPSPTRAPKKTTEGSSGFSLAPIWRWLRQVSAPIGRWLMRQVSWLEFFVLASLAVVLLIHLAALRRLQRAPTVEVGDLTNATGDADLDKSMGGLAARLRVLLKEAGIPPPTVPGGGAQDSAIAVIKASPLPHGKFLARGPSRHLLRH